MNKRYLIIAVACGLATVLLIFLYLASRKPAPPRTQEATVVAALETIPDRKIIAPEMLVVKKLPAVQVQPGALSDISQAVGQVAMGDIPAGEQITSGRIANRGKDLGLSFIIPENMRAVTISLNESSGLRGLLLPGDKVDVLITMDSTRNKGNLTFTLMRDVLVLAIGKQMDRPKGLPINVGQGEQANADLVTLAVSPEDAEKVSLAAKNTALQLVLRPAETETEPVYTPGQTVQDLEDQAYFGDLARRYGQAGSGTVIRAIRGTAVEEVVR